MADRYKALISGYYGFHNIGDESILKAVVENLNERLPGIDITVLSQNPALTSERFGVKSVNRKSPRAVLAALKDCDILISGGGSLLQDVTSRRSILYYLFIIRAAKALGKKVLIYSQGIGPIHSKCNRKLTAAVLRRVSGIVVRDEASKSLLTEIGVRDAQIVVTADPVLRIKPVPKALGMEILQKEGFVPAEGRTVVGFAIKERKMDSGFVSALCAGMKQLAEERNAQIVLIPFHFSEDMAFIEEAAKRLGDRVFAIRRKYLTEEMLSIIGNMDVLVGVRLHALIHAAIMDVPMIGISYDPKINSFMQSIGLEAISDVEDFDAGLFLEVYDKTMESRERQRRLTQEKVKALIKRLDSNEEMIRKLMEARKRMRILDVPVDKVTYLQAMERFKAFMQGDRCAFIVTPNSEIVVQAHKDATLKALVEEADLVIPDGIGLVYASRIMKNPLQERVTGIDFLRRISAYLQETGQSVFLLGGKPGVAEKAAERMRAALPELQIAGARNGYFQADEEAALVEEINASGASFLCVALGFPKQEQFISRHRTQLTHVRAAMGVGGSLDVWSGTVKRAPAFFQKCGLEWLYRVVQEPARLGRATKLPVFMVKVIANRNRN